jgi:hypothetical protein
LNGVFYGDGTVCDGANAVNCCFEIVERGTCCAAGQCLVNQTRSECTLLNGMWYSTLQECNGSGCNLGYCCYPGSQCELTDRESCENDGYTWFTTFQACNGECQ